MGAGSRGDEYLRRKLAFFAADLPKNRTKFTAVSPCMDLLVGLRCCAGLFSHQRRILQEQLVFAFNENRIYRNAVYRAHFSALRRIEMADAFRAFIGVDFVDFYALIDRIVGALGLAHVAVDALVGNHERHDLPPLLCERFPHAGRNKWAGIAAM
jgi:hypothetical protein